MHWEIIEWFVDDRARYGSGLEILKLEVEVAIESTAPREAPGPDRMWTDVIKLLDDDNIKKYTRRMIINVVISDLKEKKCFMSDLLQNIAEKNYG